MNILLSEKQHSGCQSMIAWFIQM